MTPWLDIIGVGEEGPDGLTPTARRRLAAAEVIVGGARHHALFPGLSGERLSWPSPFGTLAEEIAALRGRRVAILVTGDPLWFSAGPQFLAMFDPAEITFHPHVSSFQLAAARMKWSMTGVETLSVHGRPAASATPFFRHGARLLLLTAGSGTPAEIAGLLCDYGLGDSRMSVLGAMGGGDETRIDGVAAEWSAEAPELHVLAVECLASEGYRFVPRTGLPDDLFLHDGKMTKREIRALTLSALAPRRGEMLWDIGTGCGSVAIEWIRADREMQAIGVDHSTDRLSMAAANGARLGAPRLELRRGRVPEALADLPQPDAIFIGGGLSVAVVERALAALPPHGRLVANAVTLESEALLARMQAAHGGNLVRVSVSRAEGIGAYRGWKPAMPVTQWSLAP